MPSTADIHLALTLSALRMLQQEDAAPQPGSVSPEYIARLSRELDIPVSESHIRKQERTALLKLRHHLSESTTES
jgi:hypothetical protein